MHGPQAFANISPPIFSNVPRKPSRSEINRICSEPGVTLNSDLAVSFRARAFFATDAAREISSYEEFVHEPISPTSTFTGHLFFSATVFICEIGVARSGVKGPL